MENGLTHAPLELGQLANQINDARASAVSHARTAIADARRCGELLIEAKAQVAHGEWLPWLGENTGVGAREAQRWMRLANAPVAAIADATGIKDALNLLSEMGEMRHGVAFDRTEAREKTDTARSAYDAVQSELQQLRDSGAHKVLGYESWETYCEAEGLESDPRAIEEPSWLAAVEAIHAAETRIAESHMEAAAASLEVVDRHGNRLIPERGLKQFADEVGIAHDDLVRYRRLYLDRNGVQ